MYHKSFSGNMLWLLPGDHVPELYPQADLLTNFMPKLLRDGGI